MKLSRRWQTKQPGFHCISPPITICKVLRFTVWWIIRWASSIPKIGILSTLLFSFSTLKRVEKEWEPSRLQRGKDTTQTRRGQVEMHQDKNLTTSGPLLFNLVPMHWTC